MTTIAYKQGVLAGDTMVSFGGTKCPGEQRKVHRLRNGCLFGWAGLLEQAAVLRKAVEAGERDNPPKLKDLHALLVEPDGKVWMYEGVNWFPSKQPYSAYGTGHDFALAVMAFGGSAKDAVRVAIKLDKSSGGRVQWVSFREKKDDGRAAG